MLAACCFYFHYAEAIFRFCLMPPFIALRCRQQRFSRRERAALRAIAPHCLLTPPQP